MGLLMILEPHQCNMTVCPELSACTRYRGYIMAQVEPSLWFSNVISGVDKNPYSRLCRSVRRHWCIISGTCSLNVYVKRYSVPLLRHQWDFHCGSSFFVLTLTHYGFWIFRPLIFTSCAYIPCRTLTLEDLRYSPSFLPLFCSVRGSPSSLPLTFECY